MERNNDTFLELFLMGFIALGTYNYYVTLKPIQVALAGVLLLAVLLITLLVWFQFFSKWARERKKCSDTIKDLPENLTHNSGECVLMGRDKELGINIYLPDSIRSRHIHVLGATGSGKTESVILNFLRQDIKRNLGAIILDAKGDMSFVDSLKDWVPQEKLRIFDLSSEESLSYNPLYAGSPLEAAQRLFASLIWSEEYYKSKAFSTLQRLFQNHFERYDKNPTLNELNEYLESPDSYAAVVANENYPKKLAEKDFMDISGLRDQIRSLCIGHLEQTLSPSHQGDMDFNLAMEGHVLYFRLQSLISPQLVSILGRLIINQLNYLAGTTHRETDKAKQAKLIPTYLDEFASFACPEFADLISKARSAGMALHFSHQSIGDLTEVSKGFLNRITDNSATKIVLRINDPDSAEFFARSFGTKYVQKITQRITNSEDTDSAEIVGEGSQREAHQFRASPDLLKTLPTGMGAVLVAHGEDKEAGASAVFRVKFPLLK